MDNCSHICKMPYKYRLELLKLVADSPYINITSRTDDNAGYDCYCAIDMAASTVGLPILVPLGIKARMVKIDSVSEEEDDCHYWLLPRSSIFKKGLIMANSAGVIDKTYRGELKGPVVSYCAAQHNSGWGTVQKGERLFQIVAPDMGWIHEVRIVDALSDTIRAEGGFGSTG